MAEYIERQKLYNNLVLLAKYETGERQQGILGCAETVRIFPAADVAPVVRCKDCKYWQDNNDGYPHEECRWGHGETPDANDFCSYGERKGGEGNGC